MCGLINFRERKEKQVLTPRHACGSNRENCLRIDPGGSKLCQKAHCNKVGKPALGSSSSHLLVGPRARDQAKGDSSNAVRRKIQGEMRVRTKKQKTATKYGTLAFLVCMSIHEEAVIPSENTREEQFTISDPFKAFAEWLTTTRDGPAGFKDKLPIWQSAIGSRRAPGDGFSLLRLLLYWSRFVTRGAFAVPQRRLSIKGKDVPKSYIVSKAERVKAGWLAVMRDVTGEKQAPSGHPRPLSSLAANPFDFRGAGWRTREVELAMPRKGYNNIPDSAMEFYCVSSLICQPAMMIAGTWPS
ncbi:hypothetical protein MCOR21_010047 [Pyricularia oryzae]|nr:hypothetical protein MCOR34_009543 [Pyricularia oryzae]KAI6338763.1 hypothetical protein MCOR28_007754 [Pyricularia oryzae]KAI6369660.1 hypothetical protein MCOR32_006622 [Pyricularia oryzae]KAI6419924.1 hypothetical protein MCOR21_010047 [Pyricularia oryzae]